MTTVRFLAVPVRALLEMQEAVAGLQREVQLASIDGASVVSPAAADRIVDRRIEVVLLDLHRQALAARDAGRAVADLEVEYPDDAYTEVVEASRATDEADEAAADGHLLTPPLGPEVRHLQEWLVAQAEAQLRGGRPTPFAPDGDPLA